MKKFSAVCIAFLITATGAQADNPESVPIAGAFIGTKIISHTETQIYSKNCRAIRVWPEIVLLANPPVQTKLNARFKKILTVGKQLTAQDCPSLDSAEDYTYSNSYKVTGQVGSQLTIAFTVFMPGGSGRVYQEIRSFDWETGKDKLLKK